MWTFLRNAWRVVRQVVQVVDAAIALVAAVMRLRPLFE
jgi:hypothetical protein